MKTAQKILLILITLLAIAAGVAKVMQVPNEVAFFENLGLSTTLLLAFGVLQILGGILLVIPKTRVFGIGLTALMFLASAIMLFMSGTIPFALVSLLPVVLTLLLLKTAE